MIHKKLSWNTHYLITRIAVRHCAAAGLNDSVRIMSLEEFLALAGEDLPGCDCCQFTFAW